MYKHIIHIYGYIVSILDFFTFGMCNSSTLKFDDIYVYIYTGIYRFINMQKQFLATFSI